MASSAHSSGCAQVHSRSAMSPGRVLIPIDGPRLLEAKLDWALGLTRHFTPTIDVLFTYGVVDPITIERNPLLDDTDTGWWEAEDQWLDRSASLTSIRTRIEAWAEQRQIPFQQAYRPGTAGVRLLEVTTSYATAIEEHGRLSDLTVVGQPGRGATPLEIDINRLSLMTTGRRMVVIPTTYSWTEGTLGHILLAWEGGLQATRMFGSMMDLVAVASKVTIYTAGPAADVSQKQERMRDYLACNGIGADFIAEEHPSSRVGRRVLQVAAEHGATLVCMGAYEHPRMVELVVGGNTRHLYGRSTIPLILTY
jgi:nucleotide-binding universal stress UspA family protein